MDPGVQPRIVSTYPPDGGIGPFNVYTMGDYYNGNHFYIRFNKLMRMSWFTSSRIRCSAPGLKNLTVYANSGSSAVSGYSQIVGFQINGLDTNGYSRPLYYQIGKPYTISLDSGAVDFNGNHLESRLTFTYTPEPSFRVVRTYPQEGDTVYSTTSGISILFNADIDTSIRHCVVFQPPVIGIWSNYSNGAEFYPSGQWHSRRQFKMTVSTEASDKTGNKLAAPVTTTFYTPSFKLSTYSTPYDLNSPLVLYFTASVDSNKFKNAISILPSTPLLYTFYGSSVYVSAGNDWAPGSSYRFVISPTAADIDGSSLPDSVKKTFYTSNFYAQYAGTNHRGPGNLDRDIYVDFTGRVDSASFKNAFHVMPAMSGTFVFTNLSQPMFRPDSSLHAYATYYIKVDSTCRSIGGYAFPYSFNTTVSTGGGLAGK